MEPSARPVRAPRIALLVQQPRWFIALALLLSLLAATSLRWLASDFSMEDLYPRDDPEVAAYEEFQERFGREDGVIFLAFEGDPLSDDWLGFQQRLIDELEPWEEVESVLTLANYVVLRREGGELLTERLVPEEGLPSDPALRESRREELRAAVLADPLARGRLISEAGDAGVILIRTELLETGTAHTQRVALQARLDDALERLDAPPMRMAGVPIIRNEIVRYTTREQYRAPLVGGVLVLAFLYWIFRSPRRVILSAILLGLSALWGVSIFTSAGRELSIFSGAMTAIFVVVATSNLLHLIHRFDEGLVEGRSQRRSASAALIDVGTACFLTTATTAVGFASLGLTRQTIINDFGIFSALGLLASFCITFLLMPALLTVVKIPPPSPALEGNWTDRGLTWLLGSLGRRPAVWSVVCAVVVLGSVVGASRMVVDGRILDDLPRRSDVVLANQFVEERLGAAIPLEVEVVTPEVEGVRAPEVIAAMARLQRWAEADPIVGSSISMADLILAADRAMTGHPEGQIPTSRARISQYLLQYESAAENPLEGLITWDEDRARIGLQLRDHGAQATLAFVERLRSQAVVEFAGLDVEPTVMGMAYLGHKVSLTLTDEFSSSFLLAGALIFGATLMAFRSVRMTLISVVPNVFPMLVLAGWFGWTGRPLSTASAMPFCVGLGIAVDDTIHFLTNYFLCRRTLRGRAAVKRTFELTGRPILHTSILLAVGFGSLGLSDFRASAAFGVTTALCLIAAVFGDLVILPLMLWYLDDGPPLNARTAD